MASLSWNRNDLRRFVHRSYSYSTPREARDSHFVSAVMNEILLNGPDKLFLWFGHLLDYYIMKILVYQFSSTNKHFIMI